MRVEDFDIPGPVPYGEIEAGIRPTVRLLNDAGFRTHGSCEGHGESFPWVNLVRCDTTQLADFLHAHGAGGFTILQRNEFTGPDRCLRMTVVEFWGKECLPKLEVGT